MNIIYDLAGKKFGRLTAIEYIRGDGKHIGGWICKCDCGNETVVRSHCLRSGRIQSCGCWHKELMADMKTTHGGSKERLYVVWQDMLRRCERESSDSYDDYGGRGIKVCDSWHDYLAFKKWMLENGYDESARKGESTIDRIDVNGDYCPENCRVVSMSVQNNNRTDNHTITFCGETKTLAMWAREKGIKPGTLLYRINSKNWTIDEALNAPLYKHNARGASL